jgi:hypothetical protein
MILRSTNLLVGILEDLLRRILDGKKWPVTTGLGC